MFDKKRGQMMSENTLNDLLDNLDAGVFSKKTKQALKDVAEGVYRNPGKDKKGKIVIELTFIKSATSDRVEIGHKFSYTKPTMRGKATEEDIGSTGMYLNNHGEISVSPEAQDEMTFNESNVSEINNG